MMAAAMEFSAAVHAERAWVLGWSVVAASRNWRTGEAQAPPSAVPRRAVPSPPQSSPPTIQPGHQPGSPTGRVRTFAWVVLWAVAVSLSLFLLPGVTYIDSLAADLAIQFGSWAGMTTSLLAGLAGVALAYLWFRLSRKSPTALWPMLNLFVALSLMCGAGLALLTPKRETTTGEFIICYAIMLGVLLFEWFALRRRRSLPE